MSIRNPMTVGMASLRAAHKAVNRGSLFSRFRASPTLSLLPSPVSHYQHATFRATARSAGPAKATRSFHEVPNAGVLPACALSPPNSFDMNG